jgi:hypothetical protein
MTRLVLIVLAVLLTSAVRAEKRVALLNGNKDSKRGIGALTNPIHDVRIVGEALKAD